MFLNNTSSWKKLEIQNYFMYYLFPKNALVSWVFSAFESQKMAFHYTYWRVCAIPMLSSVYSWFLAERDHCSGLCNGEKNQILILVHHLLAAWLRATYWISRRHFLPDRVVVQVRVEPQLEGCQSVVQPSDTCDTPPPPVFCCLLASPLGTFYLAFPLVLKVVHLHWFLDPVLNVTKFKGLPKKTSVIR